MDIQNDHLQMMTRIQILINRNKILIAQSERILKHNLDNVELSRPESRLTGERK